MVCRNKENCHRKWSRRRVSVYWWQYCVGSEHLLQAVGVSSCAPTLEFKMKTCTCMCTCIVCVFVCAIEGVCVRVCKRTLDTLRSVFCNQKMADACNGNISVTWQVLSADCAGTWSQWA